MSRLRRNIEKKRCLTATCSVQQVCFESDGEYRFEGKTIAAVEREMITDGWLDDLIIEDSINLCCPACAEYLRENVSSFEELDKRVGGTAS